MHVPFFRFDFDPAALAGIEECLRSGWLTTGSKTKTFEERFAAHLTSDTRLYAVALNSCTAALHLALEAIGLRRGEIVIVPTFTFAATAEVVRYFDAIPIFVDTDPSTLNLSVESLRETVERIMHEDPIPGVTPPYGRIRAIIPVHYGGQPCNMKQIHELAGKYNIDILEDAAHAFPAGWKKQEIGDQSEQRPAIHDSPSTITYVGNATSCVTCFSFYANKTITTGEGGMAVTADSDLATRIRIMSLHGMDKDAWKRFSANGTWDYQLVAPGFKYNLTDVASAIGLSQLEKAEEFRLKREHIVQRYQDAFSQLHNVELLEIHPGVLHSHHLFILKLCLDTLRIDRAQFIEEMKSRGVMCSVHWRPLHLHPYYMATYGYTTSDFPVATAVWPRIVSLPLFPGMIDEEVEYVVQSVLSIVRANAK